MIRTMLRAQAAALVAAFLLWASPAWSQAVLQGGPVSALGGHVPTYLPSGQGGLATVMDSGGAGGGPIGFGLSEKGLQARTPPGQGTGPLGTHDCDWDTYATNPAGAHYLCFDPNINGSASIVAGATGGATQQGLNVIINGQLFPIAGVVNGLPSVPTTVLLASTLTTFAPAIIRTDYSPGFGASPAEYVAGSTACSISGGDGGSQIPSADGKCWLLTPQTAYDIRWWGLTSGPVNFYVSKSGNDYGTAGAGANFCVVQANPCLTEKQVGYAVSRFDVAGGNAQVNFGSGNWHEDFFANNELRGATNFGNNPAPWPTPSKGQLILSGNGAANTTLSGSGGLCATIAASFGAIIGVRQMTITGNATGCQSSLFAQEGGIINGYDGVVLGAASQEQAHSEDPGSEIQFWNCPTFAGNANAGTSSGQSSWVIFSPLASCSIVISGALTYGTAFNYVDTNATTQYNPGARLTPAAVLFRVQRSMPRLTVS